MSQQQFREKNKTHFSGFTSVFVLMIALIWYDNFFCVNTHKREKENNIAITNSIIIGYSGGVKQQGRVANGPFGLQIKHPP